MRFRKKPVEIEAWRWDGATPLHALPDWILQGKHINADYLKGILFIDTLEGTMRASPGDWIVKGVKGELYPVKPDIFAETFEPVE